MFTESLVDLPPYVVGFDYAQGSDGKTWTGHFDADYGKVEVMPIPDASYPLEIAASPNLTSSQAAYTYIVRSEDHSASQFYLDYFTTTPTYYNVGGALLGSFKWLQEDPDRKSLIPDLGPNAIAEFELGGEIFMIYRTKDYNKGSYAKICRLGEGGDFRTMTEMVQFPQSDMGTESDTGRRTATFDIEVKTDANGKQGAYILYNPSGQGFTYNLFAEPGFIDETGAVEAIEAVDNNAPVEFFNLQGIRVANPENGMFIRRQGNKVSKVAL